MDKKELICQFWRDVAEQKEEHLKQYFSSDATVKWHNTNELFTVDEYIIANCEYPGKWQGTIERIETVNDMVVTVVKVNSSDENISFHATSFFQFNDDKIIELNEYWGEDGQAPQWRVDKKIGCKIV